MFSRKTLQIRCIAKNNKQRTTTGEKTEHAVANISVAMLIRRVASFIQKIISSANMSVFAKLGKRQLMFKS